MSRLLILILASTLCTSCTKFAYDGVVYPETQDIQIFYNSNEIDREYEVMGMLKATGSGPLSGSNLESKMVKQARKRGADAIVFEADGEGVSTRYLSRQERPPGKLTSATKVKIKWAKAYLIKFR